MSCCKGRGLSMKKIMFCCLFLAFSLLSFSVSAATLEDARNSVINGTGKMMLPNLKKDGKTSREMTKEEATEYFAFVDKYQSENNTNIVPAEAYTYVEYISEKLDKSSNKEITDKLRSEAEEHAKKGNIKEIKSDDKLESKTKMKTKQSKKSFWVNLFSFNLFK